ncbi:response regulator [Patescibacteria group bacterium]
MEIDENKIGQKKKVLIVEDQKPLLMAIKNKLEMAGYETISAIDGLEGERLILNQAPDLVLLDVILPKKDGFQILKTLKEKKKRVPVIVISNSGQPVEIEKVLELGARDYLVKADFNPDEVLEKVEKVIGPGLSSQVLEGETKESSFPEKTRLSPSEKTVVLVVEDDEFLRKIISQKLVKEGFDVRPVIDVVGALDSMKEKIPQIILLDLILPGMDGFELLDKIKKNPKYSGIPVIVLSNLGQKEDKERATSMGAVDYLVKADYTPADIVERIRKVLRQEYL